MTTPNLSIFVQDYAPRTTRIVQTPDGTASVYSALAVGRIVGRSRTIPALVCEEVSEDDRWYIVNLNATGGYKDTVAVLGATSAEQAEDWARRQVLAYRHAGDSNAYACCTGDDATASADALQEYLNSAAAEVSFLPIRRKDIEAFEGRITDRPVAWDQEWLKSHTAAELLHELACRDSEGQMLDAMCKKDDLPKLIAQEGGEQAEYDAIIVDYNRLELMQERLMAAMAKAAVGNVRPVNVTQTKPFKRAGVTNVAIMYEMSDGQTVTIVFHSPDATPAKLGPKDTLTSWKFMLNKRDVTAAVAPENGENVQMPALAKRMLLLVEKNSARFQRSNGKKSEQMKALADTNTRIEQKTATLNGLNAEIESLQKQIDAGDATGGDAQKAIKAMLQAMRDDQELKGRIAQAAARMNIKDISGDMVENWYQANSRKYLSSLPLTQMMKAAADFKHQAVDLVNQMGNEEEKPASVPDIIAQRIKSNVEALQANAASLDQFVKTRGHGAELMWALKDMQSSIDSSMANIKKIRDAAAKNGAAAEVERLIAEAGGIPDFSQYQVDDDEMAGPVRNLAKGPMFNAANGNDDAAAIAVLEKAKGYGEAAVKQVLKTVYAYNMPMVGRLAKHYGMPSESSGAMAVVADIGKLAKAVMAGSAADPATANDGRITPDVAANMKAGEVVRTADGKEYMALGARHDWLEVAPIVNGKPQVNSQDTFKFLLSPEKAAAYPDHRNEPVYLSGRNLYETAEAGKEPASADNGQPKKNRAMEQKIKLVADSVEKLRPLDIDRVLAECGSPDEMLDLAKYIASNRPDLASRVESYFGDVLKEKGWNKAIGKLPSPPEKSPRTDADAVKALNRLFKVFKDAGINASAAKGDHSVKVSLTTPSRLLFDTEFMNYANLDAPAEWVIPTYKENSPTNQGEAELSRIANQVLSWLNGNAIKLDSDLFKEDPKWAADSGVDSPWRAEIAAAGKPAGAAGPAASGKEDWHTDVPTEGLPMLPKEQSNTYPVGAITARIAEDAVNAITKTQKLANVGLYPYYLPSVANSGRHGIVRLFPEDQKPGKPWKMLNGQSIYPGMTSDDQIKARLVKYLSSGASILAYDDQNAPGANKDADFLQSVIDNKAPDMPLKELTAKVRSIITDAKDKGDAAILALGDQAAKAVAARMKAKAQAKLAEVQ